MRTLTALALATALAFTVAGANATTTKKHHGKRHKAAQAPKEANGPKADAKAPAAATK